MPCTVTKGAAELKSSARTGQRSDDESRPLPSWRRLRKTGRMRCTMRSSAGTGRRAAQSCAATERPAARSGAAGGRERASAKPAPAAASGMYAARKAAGDISAACHAWDVQCARTGASTHSTTWRPRPRRVRGAGGWKAPGMAAQGSGRAPGCSCLTDRACSGHRDVDEG
jgi:hypothetical protein